MRTYLNSFMIIVLCLLLLSSLNHYIVSGQQPTSSVNWEKKLSLDGNRFIGKNGHAACVFQNKLWVVGGRSGEYMDYNLQKNDKLADVWYSFDAATWKDPDLEGDFFAQNIDVVQPGKIAPWFNRFGHSLNAINTTTYNPYAEADLMILAGGYNPSPDNDVWVTEDGINWLYTGKAPWSPRAWHAATVFSDGKLYIMGGTPLNNEVWRLNNVTKYRRREPLTRSHYSNYTYHLEWEFITNAPWSPRVAPGLVTHYYFDVGQDPLSGSSRMLLLGGYGGWLEGSVDANGNSLYDGVYCNNEVWTSQDGKHWHFLGNSPDVSPRAWMAMVVKMGEDFRVDPQSNGTAPAKIYLYGGGYVGFKTSSQKRVTTVVGRADAFWSYDGFNWTQINYEEGGGTSGFTFYSSQEWTETVVDTVTKYLGMWGHTVTQFNTTTGRRFPGNLIMVGGLYAGGDYSNNVWESTSGTLCDVRGTACNGVGRCNATGCDCPWDYTGIYCEHYVGPGQGSTGYRLHALPSRIVVIFLPCFIFLKNMFYDKLRYYN